MYKLYVWSDNEKAAKAIKYLYGVGTNCEEEKLPTLTKQSPNEFKLHRAAAAYLVSNNIKHIELRLAMRTDLQAALVDFKKLATFSLKNVISEEQSIAAVIQKEEVTFLAKQYSSALAKRPTATFTKILPYPATSYKYATSPSSVTISASDMKSFISITKDKVFKKIPGELLYIDGVIQSDIKGGRGVTLLGLTFSGRVNARVDDSTESGGLDIGDGIRTEITIVAIFEGEYTPGENKIAFPKNVVWYNLMKGAKSGIVEMCKLCTGLELKTKKGLSVVTGAPSILEMRGKSIHDPTATLSKEVAQYSKESIYDDTLDVNVKCKADDLASIIGSVTARGSYIGIPTKNSNMLLVRDARTQGCIALLAGDIHAVNGNGMRVAPTAKETEEEVVNAAVITSCVLRGSTYSLYVDGKLYALMPKEVLNKYEEVGTTPTVVRTCKDAIIVALTEAKGRAITKAEILDHVATSAFSEGSVSVALGELVRDNFAFKSGNKYYI